MLLVFDHSCSTSAYFDNLVVPVTSLFFDFGTFTDMSEFQEEMGIIPAAKKSTKIEANMASTISH